MARLQGEYDAIVIGGGPGGSATAIALARQGHRVLVLEGGRFPRQHVGEALVYMWSIFEHLGVADAIDPTHVHKRGSSRFWGREATLKNVHFNAGPDLRNYSLLVHRATFDQTLLDHARAAGATVREGHRVTALHWEDGRLRGVSYRSDEGAEGTVQAPFVVDAGGRARLIARQQQLTEPLPLYPQVSLYGYYRDAARLPGENAGNVLQEGTPNGWAWYIPLYTGEVSVGFCISQEGRARMAQMRLRQFFLQELAATQQIRSMLRGATLMGKVIVAACNGYRSRRYAGLGWRLVGDAGFFLDPIWSLGVSIALYTGLWAGASIDAVLSGRLTEDEAEEYHDRRFRNRVCGLDWLVLALYQANRLYPDEPFWQRCQSWPDVREMPTGLRARLGPDTSLRYYYEVFQGIGATNGHGQSLFHDVELPMDRQARFDWQRFMQSSLRLGPDVHLLHEPVFRGGRLVKAPLLRLPADAGDGPLPEDAGLDWPLALERMAAGAPVEAVVERPHPDDFASSRRHLLQTNALLDFYLQGFLTQVPANGDHGTGGAGAWPNQQPLPALSLANVSGETS